MPYSRPADLEARRSEAERLCALAVPDGERIHTPVGGFVVTKGGNLVFSAPHEVEHLRDGDPKRSEGGTGMLAARLAESIGGSSVRTEGVQLGDPNWDDLHPYTDAVLELAQGGGVLDLHIMANRGFEICLGLGEEPEKNRRMWLILVEEFLSADVRVSLNWPFGARGRTITTRALRCGIPAVQIEMIPEAFDPEHDVHVCVMSALGRAACALSGDR